MKTRERTWLFAAVTAVALVAGLGSQAAAQVGTSQGVVDANTAGEADLAAMPHMTPAIAKALVETRPFASVTELNAFLLGQGLSLEEATTFYRRAFVHVDLNSATSEEILIIPGAGRRMAREFKEYRPWKTKEQFFKEIGKYVDEKEVARLWRFVVIQ